MKKSEFVLWLVFCLATIIIIFYQNQITPALKSYLTETLRPFEIVISKVTSQVSYWQNILFNLKDLKESNSRLIAENLGLYSQLVKLSQLEEENSFLREKLNLSKKNINTLLAEVIGRDFQNNRSFLTNKGSTDGVNIGMIVTAKDTAILGRIIETTPNTSKAQTLLDTQSRVAAVTSISKISGLVRGLGSDVIFDLIIKDKRPEIGELLISSGTDGIWPQGFVIGKIKDINLQDNQVFNTAGIELLASPQNFNNVFIIIHSQ